MPDGGPKLLLIDGNNMCHRVFWTNQTLSHKGKGTGVLFGFFKQLIHLHKSYPDHFRIIVWDRGYARRLEESQKAVEAGIIPSAYKANREKNKPELEDMFEQMNQLRDSVLDMIRCVQVSEKGVEADDIIYTYTKYVQKWHGEAVVVSSDNDFFQALAPGVTIYDAMKKEVWTEERFNVEVGFSPSLWVDAGALMGDTGDNIHGVDGWGPKTTNKYVRQYGGIDAVVAAVQAKKKRSKTEQNLLDSLPRLALAKSLKQMDIIPNVPMPRLCRNIDSKSVEKMFLEFGFASLLKEIWRLV